jgi:hypothetical protein
MEQWRYSSIILDLGIRCTVGQWSASRPALPLGKEPPVPTGQEVGWAPEPVWKTWRRENFCFHRDSNSDPSAVQPLASLYTDWAISAPSSVGIVIQLRAGRLGSRSLILGKGRDFSVQCPDRFRGKLSYLHLVLRLRMHGALFSLPVCHKSSWHGA